ncbi:MAG: type II toxin-antitoxin system Phd/YefM family antitoxin [Thermoleophilaceae bacterium]|nr:type II toxin-antitoxin system Phd/YefM family antitoxin [Thermoleophilaceae bacterium]
MERITATEASRNFSELLNRARYGGESFLVERNGEAVAEIRPARKGSTVADAIDFLKTTPLPDPDFKRDMLKIIAERKRDYPRDPWDDD